MEDREDWLRLAKSGENPQAYRLWVKMNCRTVACLAFQNGVHDDFNGEYQAKVFEDFYFQLSDLKLTTAEIELYRISANTLKEFCHQEKFLNNNPKISFEEDAVLHEAMQLLELKKRIAYTLHSFHGKTPKETADILSILSSDLDVTLERSRKFLMEFLDLDERQLEKRVELLAKSYNRMTFPPPRKTEFSKDPLLIQMQDASKTENGGWSGKKVSVFLIVSCCLLGTIIISSFANEEFKSKDSIDIEDPMEGIDIKVREWKEQYDEIKRTSPELMGIAPETYQNLSFVREADHLMQSILGQEDIKEMKEQPRALENQFTRALFHIQTPKGMLELLEAKSFYPMGMDEFVYEYANKTAELMEVADQVLKEHNEEFTNTIIGGQRSSEILVANSNNYSERAANLLKGLDEQMLTVISHPIEKRYITKRNMEQIYSVSTLMNDWTVSTNLSMLGKEPFYDETGLLISLEEAAYRLKELESYLLDEQSESMLYTEFLHKFEKLFWLMLKGSDSNPVFHDTGVVKDEYKAAWHKICDSQKNPIVSIMLPILEEMEETGWTESDHYEQLSQKSIVNAMQMELAGVLLEEMPHGHMAAGSEFIDMTNFSYDDYKDLYHQFKNDYDLTLLSGKSPVEIYFLYHYANYMEDPETMWHLLVEDEKKPKLDDFIVKWQKLPDISKSIRWIEITGESFYWSSKTLHVNININYKSDNLVFKRGPVLVTTEQGIWLIKYLFSESNSTYQLNGELKDRLNSIYNSPEDGNASPAEVF